MEATQHAPAFAHAAGPAALPCLRCAEPFLRQAHLDLHLGRAHLHALGEAERDAFARALAEEEAWLAAFRRRMRAALGMMPAVFVLLVSAGLLLALDLGLWWVFLLTPGTLSFGALMAYAEWQREDA